MNRKRVAYLLIGLLVVGGVGPGASGATATWTGEAGGGTDPAWTSPGNWLGVDPQHGYPGGNGSLYDVVIADTVPQSTVTLNAVVDVDNLTVGLGMRVTIQDNGDLELTNVHTLDCDGMLQIERGGTFTLRQGAPPTLRHVLAGTIALKSTGSTTEDATFNMRGNVIVDGEPSDGSGDILGETANGVIDGNILNGDHLIIEDVVIHGKLEVKVQLLNKGAVNADSPNGELRLTGDPKFAEAGTRWYATGGILVVSTIFSDGGYNPDVADWFCNAGEIEFNFTNFDPVRGALSVSGTGVIDVNAAFAAEGKITVTGGGKIDAAAPFSWGFCP
jgi:hypothetical protein